MGCPETDFQSDVLFHFLSNLFLLEFTVNGRIQRGVVVHLQLAVEFEAPRAGQRLRPQGVQAFGQVGALLLKNGEPLAVALAVSFRRTLPLSLFPRVIDLQRQN